MTISSPTSRVEYVGNGSTTEFATDFKFLADDHVKVFVDEVEQVLNTDYTMTGVELDAGGTVIFTVAPAAQAPIVILRDLPAVQEVDYISGDPFPAETHERALDYLTMLVQNAEEELARTMKLAVTDTSGVEVTLPTPAPFTFFQWNEDGTKLQLVTADEIATTTVFSNFKSDMYVDGVDYTSGTTESLTLTASAGVINNTQVYFDGVYQEKTNYTLTLGTQVDFTTPIPLGVTSVEVVYGTALPQADIYAQVTLAEAAADSAQADAATATEQAGIATSQAGIASSAATNASNSETAAAASATAAAASESNAAASESNAAASASAANNSKDYATEWANNPEDSLVSAIAGGDLVDDYSALHHANKASASASAASVSESNAAGSEAASAASAAAAATSETNASTSETNADNSATSASGSASTATSQAGIATTKAGEASDSADAAAASETSAEGHKDLAYTYWQNAASAVAYQDLAAIAESKAVTAVDVFVYDTSKDSDGGAWRKRTQNTSWYNETLNTATRGARKEFPAVAVVVAESNKVTIYDGDDPSLPMWMVFSGSNSSSKFPRGLVGKIGMLNAKLVNGGNSYGLDILDFVSEDISYTNNSYLYGGRGVVSDRNGGLVIYTYLDSSKAIVNQAVNDVAMTVLPNAPIDSATDLPVPTIAVATDGGVSVIKDDGNVVDSTPVTDSTPKVRSINWDTDKFVALIYTGPNGRGAVATYTGEGTLINLFSSYSYLISQYVGTEIVSPNVYFYGSDAGMHLASSTEYANGVINNNYYNGGWKYDGITFTDYDDANPTEGMSARVTSDYNTGWMHGDIKGAFLSDTTAETVGVDESTELVTNGTFDTDASGWTTNEASLVSSQLVLTSDGSAPRAYAYQAIPTVAGKSYSLSIDVIGSPAGGDYRIFLSTNDNAWDNASGLFYDAKPWSRTSPPTLTTTFVAQSTTTYLYITSAVAATTLTFDNISVKQTGNLVVNGTFDVNTSGWTLLSVGTSSFTAVSGEGSLDRGDQSSAQAYQIISTVEGKSYTLVVEKTSGLSTVKLSSTSPNGTNLYSGSNDSNTVILTFTAESTTTYLTITNNQATAATVDNISVRLAESDRSVNNNGLEVHGEIVKSPVATGADLVAYSGFTSDDYLEQPYNSDLDFIADGKTNPYVFMGWIKTSGGTEHIINFGKSDSEQFIKILMASWSMGVWVKNTSGQSDYLSTTMSSNVWNFVVIINNGSNTFDVYINGNFEETLTVDATKFPTDTSGQTLKIGYQPQTNLALWRLSATVPTAEQIARIYEDEKVLFQEGAQATLYGTSDAVTALAYDDTTELLHVGTSSGRSVFSGLRRVDNTSDAVGTAISAHNGLVVEE